MDARDPGKHYLKLRMQLGWTQAQMANRLRCSRHQVSDFELGKSTPWPEVLQALRSLESERAGRAATPVTPGSGVSEQHSDAELTPRRPRGATTAKPTPGDDSGGRDVENKLELAATAWAWQYAQKVMPKGGQGLTLVAARLGARGVEFDQSGCPTPVAIDTRINVEATRNRAVEIALDLVREVMLEQSESGLALLQRQTAVVTYATEQLQLANEAVARVKEEFDAAEGVAGAVTWAR